MEGTKNLLQLGKALRDGPKFRGLSSEARNNLLRSIKWEEGVVAAYEAKQHDYIFNVFGACFMMIAHLLFGLSGGKRRPRETEDDKAVMRDMVVLGANVLARAPGHITEAALDDTAEYVSKLNHVDLNKTQVAEAIRGKIDALSRAGWRGRVAHSSVADRIHRGPQDRFPERFPKSSKGRDRTQENAPEKSAEGGPSIA